MVFFVLSGFLVGGSTLRAMKSNLWTWKEYLLQRLTRMWMVLVPALVLCALLDNLGLSFFSGTSSIYTRTLGRAAVGANFAAHLSPTVFFGNLFFLQGILTPIFGSNAPLWSLSYEFWYYIAFPLIAFGLLERRSFGRRILALAGSAVVLVLCGTAISSYMLIWMMGALVSRLPLKLKESRARKVIPVAWILFFAFVLVAVGRSWNVFASDLATGGLFSSILWLLLHCRRPAKPSLYRKASSQLSAMSYTLYCVHVPILVLLNALLLGSNEPMSLSARSLLTMITVTAITFIASYGLFRCFEANTGRLRRAIAPALGIRI
jgi:peptidoglycan/LPS O-acetylase OafA/YrhL